MMKTIKNILSVVLILLHVSVFAQEKQNRLTSNNTNNVTGGGSNDGPPPISLPNLTPPSPEAFAITKYGDIKVNEFNGMISETVPLYTFKAGKIEVPITLNYSGAGLKVDDFPTKTGMVWTLRAGGIITRTIKDKPDEEAGTGLRIFNTAEQFVESNDDDGSSGATYLSSLVSPSNPYDTEADIFNYDFNGYSGSFFLDQDFNPVLIKEESPLKIERYGNLMTDKKFIITTPDGVKYIFGGVDGVETTFKIHNVNDEPVGDTSYHLIKIIYPNNSEVNFEYLTLPRYQTFLGVNESMTMVTDHNYHGGHLIPNGPGADFIPCLPPGIQATTTYSTENLTINNVRYIKKISSPDSNEVINFNYQDLISFKVLDNIEVKTLNQEVENLKKAIQFNYSNLTDFATSTQHKRFFLESIVFDNQVVNNTALNNKIEKWKFDYDSYSGLPNRGSFAQDEAGYYNGKYSNATLLSSADIPSRYGTNYSFVGGDRTPNFTYAKKGSLAKITYPTGGYTTFEYESIPYKKPVKTNYAILVSSGAPPFGSDPDDFPSIGYSSIPGEDGLGGTDVFPAIIQTQDVEFTGDFNRSDQHNSLSTYNIKITNISDNLVIYDTIKHYAYHYPFKFTLRLLKDKLYKFEVTDLNPGTTRPYAGGVLSFSVITHYEYGDGNGVRIKRQIDYAKNNERGNYKRYYYMPTNYINLPIQNQPLNSENRFIKFRNSMIYKPGGCPVLPYVGMYSAYETLFSHPVINLFMDFSIMNRCVVTSYGGENFQKGGMERFYHIEDDYDFGNQELNQMSGVNLLNGGFSNQIAKSDFLEKTSNINLLNGTLEKEYYFTKENNSFFKIKQINYNYNNESFDGYVNFVGKSFYDPVYYPPGINIGTTTSNCYLKMYKTFTFRNFLKTKDEISYFDKIQMPEILFNTDEGLPYSISEFSDSSIKKVEQTLSYTYGSLKGLPTIISTTGSDGSFVETRNTYVDEFNTLTGLASNHYAGYAGLLSQNIVANPIEVRQYRNSSLLSTQRTLYKDWNGLGLVLPEIIQTAKGSQNLEDRVVFGEYDAKGNPTLVSYTGGMKTKYVYNSLNQVIAKLDNFTGSLDPNTNSIADACTFIHQYPTAQVTVYTYDAVTNLPLETIDSNCRKTTYVYDDLHHLKQIKDHNGNLIKEFDNNYRPQ